MEPASHVTLPNSQEQSLKRRDSLASEVREVFTLYRWVAARPILTWNLIVAVAILVSQLVPFVCLVIKRF
jgi:hypothetical protein